MDYDEETELTNYVWGHFSSLMTDFERRVGSAIVARLKAPGVNNPTLARMLNDRWGKVGDPEIDAALAGGAEAFRRLVCRRVLAEHGGEVYVNRCPRCTRVVRTPQARQCFWCGFDWHDLSR